MMTCRKYKVAGHLFSVRADEGDRIWEQMQESYSPFGTDEVGEERFCLTIVSSLPRMDGELVYTNAGEAEEGFPDIALYKGEDGLLFEITQPGSDKMNARLLVMRKDSLRAFLLLDGREIDRWFSFTSAMNICYIMSTSAYSTELMHASSVIYKGWAYIFLGKSGTGKSTHSRMWKKALGDVVLMNDDHPVLRVEEDGTVRAYGSPWSGKTPCYKNISAPLGGIIRISRAPYNKATSQSPLQAYASLRSSCSLLNWSDDLAEGRHACLESIVAKVPSYEMECLPDEDAGRVCCEAVQRKEII